MLLCTGAEAVSNRVYLPTRISVKSHKALLGRARVLCETYNVISAYERAVGGDGIGARSTMDVRVRLFAALREAVGVSEISVDMPEGAPVSRLLGEVQRQHPPLANRCEGVVVAVNREYVDESTPIAVGDEVALIPPVSGGAVSGSEGVKVGVTREPLDAYKIADSLRASSDGAVITFEGVVRDNNLGRRVLFLEYEAYGEMAESVLRRIGRETLEDSEIGSIALWHRIGQLEIGETSLVVAVASPHRRAAFDACREAVEKVKALAPVWKREVWDGGAEWLRGAG